MHVLIDRANRRTVLIAKDRGVDKPMARDADGNWSSCSLTVERMAGMQRATPDVTERTWNDYCRQMALAAAE